MIDTIIAPASGNSKAGVAVIRVSGKNAKSLALRFSKLENFKPRYAHYCDFLDTEGDFLDSGLCLFFPGPGSFTGEDVVEFHLHGSRAIVLRFIEAALATGLVRIAEAGEFTRRAFLNDKMDLSQAEGLMDLIDSETEAQRKQALRLMKGELGDKAREWREEIVTILAEAEAYIDFPDEDLPDGLSERNRVRILNLMRELESAVSHFRDFRRIRDGFTIVLIGAPNAGKSSLLNALCGREAAIVSSIAGTTRDIVEVSLNMDGFLVHINDTAGLREANDAIEQEGIKRALERCENADLIIGLAEGQGQIDTILEHLESDSIIVWSKSDLHGNTRNTENLPFKQIPISSKNRDGIDILERAIIERVSEFSQDNGFVPINRLRHVIAIEEALIALDNSFASSEIALELGCEDLRFAAFRLGEIIGKIGVDDLLDKIFSSFCIGK